MTKPLARVAVASLLVSCLVGHAYEWPQWQGPNRDGLTQETGLLQEWPEGGPERVWLNRDCGLGYSGPAVSGGKLFILGSRNEVEQLIAFDAATGEELWSADLGKEYPNNWGNGPRNTPTVDGDHVYALGAQGALVCVSASDGSEIWRADLIEMGGKVPQWGFAESPLVDDDRVIVTPGEEGGIVALDKNSGEPIWKTSGVSDNAHYSSPVVAAPHGQKQYVRLLPERLVGLDPEDGALLWEAPWPGRVAVIPTPIVRGNKIYVTTGYGVGCMLVEIAEDNTASVIYENKLMKNQHGGVVLLGDHVYGHSDGVGWLCQDFETGERVWRERGALGKGAIGYADGRFYCLSEDEGEVALVEASPEGWTERGRFTLEPQTELRKPNGKIWVHPVIVDGRMYLRDQELLFAFDVSAE